MSFLRSMTDAVLEAARSPMVQRAGTALVAVIAVSNFPLASAAIAVAAATKVGVTLTDKSTGEWLSLGLSALPQGVTLDGIAAGLGACMTALNGTVRSDEPRDGGVVTASASQNGIFGEVRQTLDAVVNSTCTEDLLTSVLSGVNPTPANPGDGANAGDLLKTISTVAAVTAGALVVGDMAMAVYKKHRALALAANPAAAPLLSGGGDAEAPVAPVAPVAPAAPAAPAASAAPVTTGAAGAAVTTGAAGAPVTTAGDPSDLEL